MKKVLEFPITYGESNTDQKILSALTEYPLDEEQKIFIQESLSQDGRLSLFSARRSEEKKETDDFRMVSSFVNRNVSIREIHLALGYSSLAVTLTLTNLIE